MAALIPSVKLYVPLPTVVVVEFGGSPAPIPQTLNDDVHNNKNNSSTNNRNNVLIVIRPSI